jgi:DNA-binding CsgD family transcriptional regulator
MGEPRASAQARLESAVEAFNRAEFTECDAMIGDLNPADPSVAILYGRLLLRTNRSVEAVRVLLNIAPPENPELEAERRILLGCALGVTRDFEAGVNEIRRGLAAHPSPSIAADGAYYIALINLVRHDNAAAELALEPLLSSTNPGDRGRGRLMAAWIASARQDMKLHIELLTAALGDFEEAPDRADLYHVARVLSTLASLCREMELFDLTRRVRTAAAEFPWTSGLAASHSHVLRAFGWIDALEGDTISAFRQLKHAAAIAPSDSWRLLSMLDRAFLARSTGELSFAADQLTDALEFADRIKWNDTFNEESMVLLVLAQLVAPSDPAAAVSYLGRYRNLTIDAKFGTINGDPRLRAFAALADGIARASLGDTDEATRLLQDACSTFEAYSYNWRAALAAHHLFELTGERKWHEIASLRIAAYPNSWLARRIRESASSHAGSRELTPAQRQVFDALFEGASTNEIARRIERSPNTVRNHISDIFAIYGVRSRAELFALLRQT